MASAHSVVMLVVRRLLAGLGLGGLLPNGAALIAEYTPLRLRSMMVMLAMTCVPVGGIVAGLMTANLLASHGWRVLFALSGAISLAFVGGLFFVLPESPRFLARRDGRTEALMRLLAQVHVVLPPGAVPVADARELRTGGA